MKYFRDVDKGYIVRKPEEGIYLEYTFEGANEWLKTEPDSSYEREYWFGEGNTCLFDISEEEALAVVSSWNIGLSEQQIFNAKDCFLFGNECIYIVIDNDGDVFRYYINKNKWDTRNSNSFWDSWDFDPCVFEPIDKKKVVELIFTNKKNESHIEANILTSNIDTMQDVPTSNIVEQMVDGIVGKEKPDTTN